MSKDTWSDCFWKVGTAAAIGAVTGGAKEALNLWQPGSGAAVDLAQAGVNFYNDEKLDGAINTASGFATIYQSGETKQKDPQKGKEIPLKE